MALYKDTSSILLKEREVREFYRFEGGKTSSKLDLDDSEEKGYIYISKSLDHHMYFMVKRLKQLLNQIFWEEERVQLTNASLHSNDVYPHIKKIVLDTEALKPLHSYRLVCSSRLGELMKENCIHTDEPKNGKHYIERVDRRVYGGGYGLSEEWKELLKCLTFFKASAKINRRDLLELVSRMRTTNKIGNKENLRFLVTDRTRYQYEINPKLMCEFQKYNIVNLLEEILEKDLVMPDSYLAMHPTKAIKEVVEDYEEGREKNKIAGGKFMPHPNEHISRYMAVLSFLTKHPDYFEEYEISRIKNYALQDSSKDTYTRDVMREIYDELGMIPEEKNMYIAFLKEIEEQFGVNGRNIVEVGGGILPRLGKRIHLKQKEGTITVYDSRLGKDIEGEERFILKREDFTRKTQTENCDLLIGLMPCKGAEPLLEQATKKNIDFMLWFCEGGAHGDCFDYFEDEEEWLGSMMYTAQRGVEDSKMGKLKVKKLEEFSHYPIIYNQR